MVARKRMSRIFAFVSLGLALLLAVPAPLLAQAVVTPTEVPCLVVDGNTPVMLQVRPERGLSSVRVYFRAVNEPEDFYYLEMRDSGAGNFWAVLPMPERDTREAELFFRVTDGEGRVTETETETVEVVRDCDVDLNPEQKAFARNLVIGETSVEQEEDVVLGWQCPGIISRVDVQGSLRPDDVCHALLLARASRRDILIPALLIGGAVGGAVILDRRDPSPSRP